jgi:hypothetical protein
MAQTTTSTKTPAAMRMVEVTKNSFFVIFQIPKSLQISL